MRKRSSGAILYDLLITLNQSFNESEKDNIIDVNSMYGIFLDNNKFIVCKEDYFYHSKHPDLFEFFTHERVGHGHIGHSEIICNWRKGGKIYLDGVNQFQMGFCVPLTELLIKFPKNGVTTEKDLAYIYLNVNKYIRENPDFVEQLFSSKNEKTR